MKKVFTGYIKRNENNTLIPFFTTCEIEASQTDQSYVLASIEDIEDCDITSAMLNESIIQLKEGICIWKKVILPNPYDEPEETYWRFELIPEYIPLESAS